MDYGIKISQEGFDITDTDDKMILTSKFPFLKAFAQGSFSKSITGSGAFSQTINHNLGYAPAYIYFGEINPSSPNDRFPGSFAAIAIGAIYSVSHIDSTSLTISWVDTSAGFFASFPYTVNFYYYLFYDQLS